MKKILITGGAGFIGSRVALKLIEKGYLVTVLDNLSVQIHGDKPEETSPLYQSILGKLDFINGSVTNMSDWEKAIKEQDAVIHMAAETGTGQSMYCIEKYVNVNSLGTANLLDILANKENQIQKVIIPSSRAIYGEGKYLHPILGAVYPSSRKEQDMLAGNFEVKYSDDKDLQLVPTDENSKIHPSSLYGITKYNQEQMIMTVCPSLNINAVALRYQNVYGPGQSLSNPYTGILSIFSTQILNRNEINIFEDGKESRDFVYIDDVVDATILALEKDEANNQVFNVGTGIPTDVVNVAKTLVKEYNIEVPFKITGNFRIGDIRHNIADISKIETLLGYSPKISFSEGIQKFCSWVLEQEVYEDNLEKSLQEMKEKGLYK
ncbi:NAD-dependent epimerase/dehydratase family protein [Chryseobacterium sp. CT-SW4]|uniref:NAD-dependent epimerase/dehydratase family protein n=1 Tax=Chryseobacterium sp. SW-1 TaxID=3157343 RepID=UPI003B021FEB